MKSADQKLVGGTVLTVPVTSEHSETHIDDSSALHKEEDHSDNEWERLDGDLVAGDAAIPDFEVIESALLFSTKLDAVEEEWEGVDSGSDSDYLPLDQDKLTITANLLSVKIEDFYDPYILAQEVYRRMGLEGAAALMPSDSTVGESEPAGSMADGLELDTALEATVRRPNTAVASAARASDKKTLAEDPSEVSPGLPAAIPSVGATSLNPPGQLTMHDAAPTFQSQRRNIHRYLGAGSGSRGKMTLRYQQRKAFQDALGRAEIEVTHAQQEALPTAPQSTRGRTPIVLLASGSIRRSPVGQFTEREIVRTEGVASGSHAETGKFTDAAAAAAPLKARNSRRF